MIFYLCECRACGSGSCWPSMDDAHRWGDSHYAPYLVGHLLLTGAMAVDVVILR